MNSCLFWSNPQVSEMPRTFSRMASLCNFSPTKRLTLCKKSEKKCRPRPSRHVPDVSSGTAAGSSDAERSFSTFHSSLASHLERPSTLLPSCNPLTRSLLGRTTNYCKFIRQRFVVSNIFWLASKALAFWIARRSRAIEACPKSCRLMQGRESDSI